MPTSLFPFKDSEIMSKLFVKKLSSAARLPVRGSKQAAGYDLHSAHEVVIPAMGKGIVSE